MAYAPEKKRHKAALGQDSLSSLGLLRFGRVFLIFLNIQVRRHTDSEEASRSLDWGTLYDSA